MRRALLSMTVMLLLTGCSARSQEPMGVSSSVTTPPAPTSAAAAATAPSMESAPATTAVQAPTEQPSPGLRAARQPVSAQVPDAAPGPGPSSEPTRPANAAAEQVNVEATCPQTPCGPTPQELLDASDKPRYIPEGGWVWDDHEVPAFDESGHPVGGRPWNG